MRWWDRSRRIEELVTRHLEIVDASLRKFQEALGAYLDGRPGASALAAEVHALESQADDVRREVVVQLLQGALLADSRGDLMGLIEGLDDLANGAEEVIRRLSLQGVRIPEPLAQDVREIGRVTMAIMDEIKAAVHLLFTHREEALQHTHRVEKLEGEIDRIQQGAIRRLFQMELELAEKIWVTSFIERLAQLSDQAEDLSDAIEIIVAKRKV